MCIKINGEKVKRQKRYVQSILQADFYGRDPFFGARKLASKELKKRNFVE